LPLIGSTCVSLASRSATGSCCSRYASSSIALSSAKNALISNGARMKPGVCVSSRTSVAEPRKLGMPYMREVDSAPLNGMKSKRDVYQLDGNRGDRQRVHVASHSMPAENHCAACTMLSRHRRAAYPEFEVFAIEEQRLRARAFLTEI